MNRSQFFAVAVLLLATLLRAHRLGAQSLWLGKLLQHQPGNVRTLVSLSRLYWQANAPTEAVRAAQHAPDEYTATILFPELPEPP